MGGDESSKTFRKLILFCVFAKSTSFVKKVWNPRPGEGAVFMNTVEKKKDVYGGEKRGNPSG